MEAPSPAAEAGQPAAGRSMLRPEGGVTGVLQQLRDAVCFTDGKPLAEHSGLSGPQRFLHARPGEIIESTLHAAAVRILGAGEAPAGQPQLLQRVVQRAPGHLPVILCSGLGIGLQIGVRQQGVVAEHFLKMGNPPCSVRAVPAESAAHLIEEPAPGHPGQGIQRRLPGRLVSRLLPIGQQEEQRVGNGELGRAAEPSVYRIEALQQLLRRPVQQDGGRSAAVPMLPPAGDVPRDLPAQIQQLLPAGVPQPPRLVQQLQQPQLSLPASGRQIGSRPEGLLFRGQQEGQGPASCAGQGLAGRHIYPVDVGPFLPVHLDRNEVPVQYRRHLRIAEGFLSHHMTPVAGGVADGEEDGLVLFSSLRQRAGAPGPPVHGISGVLEEVGGFLVLQEVTLRQRGLVHLIAVLS